MTKLVTDMPEWTECPFRTLVPNCYSIRRKDDLVAILYQNGEVIKHIEFSGLMDSDKKLDQEQLKDRLLRPMIGALAGSIIEHEFPGQFAEAIKADAETSSRFELLHKKYLPMIAREQELNPFGSSPLRRHLAPAVSGD